MYNLYEECGSTASSAVILEAWPEDDAFLIYIYAQMLTGADWEAPDVVLDTFQVAINE